MVVRSTAPSGLPNVYANPALVVASASNPIDCSKRAVPASHGFGMINAPSRAWSARNAATFSACVRMIEASTKLRRSAWRMERWPQLRYDEWKDTLQTLQRWTQIVGKIRLRLQPLINHWWNVTLYVTPRGLTTSPMPYSDGRTFSIDFDFIDHVLHVADCDAKT